jgi:hypothetical protein
MAENGRPTSQQILNVSLSVVVALVGLLWVGLRSQVDRAEAMGNDNARATAVLEANNVSFQREVLHRLQSIEEKMDKRP